MSEFINRKKLLDLPEYFVAASPSQADSTPGIGTLQRNFLTRWQEPELEAKLLHKLKLLEEAIKKNEGNFISEEIDKELQLIMKM